MNITAIERHGERPKVSVEKLEKRLEQIATDLGRTRRLVQSIVAKHGENAPQAVLESKKIADLDNEANAIFDQLRELNS